MSTNFFPSFWGLTIKSLTASGDDFILNAWAVVHGSSLWCFADNWDLGTHFSPNLIYLPSCDDRIRLVE